jgi:hypothetical protein
MFLKRLSLRKESSTSISENKIPKFIIPLVKPSNHYFDNDSFADADAIAWFNKSSKLQSHSPKIDTISAGKESRNYFENTSDDDYQDEESDDVEGNDDEIRNRFEFLLRLFINLGYSICLIPFHLVPVKIGHKVYYEIRHYTPQRVYK